ncbi:histone deacetylase HDT1 isoform X2 [Euphorbia lathyris]|uniref:histone deacetylase HDT1 isoform X2 n=1 Tax=Euphorbia lathyris TaxID=212925 RepID=UPI003313FF70
MEFWGVEVKSGQRLAVEVGSDFLIRCSQACLGDLKKDKGNESVCLFLKVGDRKFVIGRLSAEKCPQLSFDLAFERSFELSHNWKYGSVYFNGYKMNQEVESDSESEEEITEIVPVASSSNSGKSSIKNKEPQTEEAKSESKKIVKIVEPTKSEDAEDGSDSDDADDSSDTEESSEDQDTTGNSEDDESDSDDDDEEEEEAPRMMKNEQGKKRSAEPAKKTPRSDKKAKLETPQKTDGKKVVGHVATPHPSKQIGKTPASSSSLKKDQSEKPVSCSSCNRSFVSEFALQSHSKAKHGAA